MGKIYIIGDVASGKTTLAKRLSLEMGIKYYEVDSIIFDDTKKGNRKRSSKEQIKIINKINEQSSWIIEGTYRKSSHIILDLADIIIFLDTPLIKRKIRILTRFIKQKLHIEKCNYEANLGILRSMYKWANKFEENKEEIKEMLNNYKDKLIVIKNVNRLRI